MARDTNSPRPRTPDNAGAPPAPRTATREAAAPLPYREADTHGPSALVTRRAADRLRAGHLWVYRSEIEALIPALGTETIPAGALVTLLDSREIPLGTAIFSDTSELTLRKISAEPRLTRGEYLDDLRNRVRAATTLRAPMLAAGDTDSARLLFAEADNLPGIVADRYRDLVILQLLAQGTAQPDVRELLAAELALPGIRAVIERPDPRIRQLENLPLPPSAPLYLATADSPDLQTTFTLNGLQLHYDANAGQKTGAFLDQRLNYAAAAHHAAATRAARNQPAADFRALDICTYQGGFALHLARVCTHVTGVDASRAALETAEQNLQRNRASLSAEGISSPLSSRSEAEGFAFSHFAEVDWVEADAFELLRSLDSDGTKFDTVVLDPPAFAKSRRAVEGALRGYKELNLRALRMLTPGGILVTCSCSHHISLQDFTNTVAEAASDTGRHLRLLETRAAAPDHPEVLTLPETRYLKCLILQAD